MKEARKALLGQLEKLSKASGSETEIAHAMYEIAGALIAIERAEVALCKGEYGKRKRI